MKKIVAKKRHSIRRSQGQELLSRLAEQIGESAKLFHADMIEVLETNADVSLFMVNKKPFLMDTGQLGLSHPERGGADTVPGAQDCRGCRGDPLRGQWCGHHAARYRVRD